MFHSADAALIRAASYPHDLVLPNWPDLTADQPGDQTSQWLDWLQEIWELPEFPAAVTQAAPDLAARIVSTLTGEAIQRRRLRRLVETMVRYLLRWTTRPTPFGHFAGVAPVEFGPRAAVRWGQRHRDVIRADDRYIAEQTAVAERDLRTLRTVSVVTNSLGYVRGGVWVQPCARSEHDRIFDVEIELTGPVRFAVEAARTPIGFADLAAKTAEELATANSVTEAEALLTALVHAGVLLSQVHPPMTVTDPAAYLARYLVGQSDLPGQFSLPDPGDQIAIDRRIDCAVTLPPAVAREAASAACVLAAVAPRLPGWHAYHHAFIERWGPGAAVPLREVLNVLGFPDGYRGSTRAAPSSFTDSDALLIALAQQSAMDGCREVVIDDELIEALRGDDDRPIIPHTELRFTLAADTPRDLESGAFTLTVVSGARHAGVAAARFLHLLTPAEQERFRRVYADLPTAMTGADIVQLSAPPLDTRLATLARTPQLRPVLPVGDFHPTPATAVQDLAVAGDARQLWLMSLATERPVEPLLINCVLLPAAQQPLVRFLTEIWTAWTAPCMPFDWGHARNLPFLPRLRHGRSILHPARWIISQTDLPDRVATWPQWQNAWQRRRDRNHVPRHVLIGDDDVRLRLDLDEPAHLALLRSHLGRHTTAVLTEAPAPAGWIDGRPAELLLTLTSTPPHPPTPVRPTRPASTLQHWPGQSPWLEARLQGPADHILTWLTEGSEFPEGWWFLRYPYPSPHLRIRLPLRDLTFADAARGMARRAAQLHNNGLLTDYTLATYRPETRHGTGPTLAAAEAVFAADSAAALARLSSVRPRDLQATAAAGMRTIADAFAGDGARWLADHVPHHGGARLDTAQLTQARHFYPNDGLHAALTAYRTLADSDGLDSDRVLADLLHLHHARVIGVDTASERQCLRLARAIALTDLAGRPP